LGALLEPAEQRLVVGLSFSNRFQPVCGASPTFFVSNKLSAGWARLMRRVAISRVMAR
jgi:hypothetical protein